MKIYAGTVALEKNRWSSRIPSIDTMAWMERFQKDGFDGVEIWENHFTSLPPQQQKQLRESGMIAVFNCYCTFEKGVTDHLKHIASSIAESGAKAVKYNIGLPGTPLQEQAETLLNWTALLPPSVKLLCECHAGTQMEYPKQAAALFEPLDEKRFGAITHLSADEELLREQLAQYGSRIWHVHCQSRIEISHNNGQAEPQTRLARLDETTQISLNRLQALTQLKALESLTLEFTKDGANPEETYINLLADRRFIMEAKC